MPVTAKLSRKFYDAFGDDIANELVNWFNAVDATYRSDLRELNELNFARFDARLDQRFAEADARWERRISEVDAKLEKAIATLRGEMRAGFAEQRADLLRWMFIYWGGSVVTTVGLVLLVLGAVRP